MAWPLLRCAAAAGSAACVSCVARPGAMPFYVGVGAWAAQPPHLAIAAVDCLQLLRCSGVLNCALNTCGRGQQAVKRAGLLGWADISRATYLSKRLRNGRGGQSRGIGSWECAWASVRHKGRPHTLILPKHRAFCARNSLLSGSLPALAVAVISSNTIPAPMHSARAYPHATNPQEGCDPADTQAVSHN